MKITVHQNRVETGLSAAQIKKLCRSTAKDLELQAESCAVIFVDDQTLAEMHGRYLNDSEPTDIITFNLGGDQIEGELYISVDRASDQAKEFNVAVREEICRLIIHGLLHLKGFNDTAENERIEMKQLENKLVDDYCKKI